MFTVSPENGGIEMRRTMLSALTLAVLLAGGVTGVAHAEETPPDRVRALNLLENGGPAVVQAATAALTGTDDDVRDFLGTGFAQADAEDVQVRVTQLLSAGGPGVKAAAQRALAGTTEQQRTFLDSGWQAPADDDLAVRITQVMQAGG